MRTAGDILNDLGGAAEVARETGIPYTTVLGWRDANFIPEWRRDALLSLAEQRSVELAPDAFPAIGQRRPRSKAAA